jgi:CheY-like chemotaxis protein
MEPRIKNKKIILAEDDKNLLDVYRKMFSVTDYDVEVATSADQISEELRLVRTGNSTKPDLIIMDLMLPYANGEQVLRSIKKSYHTKDIPVFVLSNYQNFDLHESLASQNIMPEKYLIKSNYTPAEIIGLINQHFSAVRPRPDLA